MAYNVFESPVWVYSGLNIPIALNSASRAHAFLLDIPGRLRIRGYAAAVNACEAALRREIEAETARGLFAAYAENAGILVPEVSNLVAAAAIGHSSSGASA